MNFVNNEFEGMYSIPLTHPITCANPAPWEIVDMKLEINPLKIWIRGIKSMWFRADQCFIHTRKECEEYIKIKEQNL